MTDRDALREAAYAPIYIDGGTVPSLAQIDAFLRAHFNARAVYLAAEPGLDNDHYPGCDRNPCRCAGVTAKPGLTEAWARAEAALPVYVRRQAAENPDEEWGKPGDWRLAVAGQGDQAIAWVYDPLIDSDAPEDAPLYELADTPAAALIALAEKLEADQ